MLGFKVLVQNLREAAVEAGGGSSLGNAETKLADFGQTNGFKK